jgi:phosphatidate phosphatase LPIN
VFVNGVKTDWHMKLGSAGEAFFVLPAEEPVDDVWMASPPMTPVSGHTLEQQEVHVNADDLKLDHTAAVQVLVPGPVPSKHDTITRPRAHRRTFSPPPPKLDGTIPLAVQTQERKEVFPSETTDHISGRTSANSGSFRTPNARSWSHPARLLSPPLSPQILPQDTANESERWSWGWGSLPVHQSPLAPLPYSSSAPAHLTDEVSSHVNDTSAHTYAHAPVSRSLFHSSNAENRSRSNSKSTPVSPVFAAVDSSEALPAQPLYSRPRSSGGTYADAARRGSRASRAHYMSPSSRSPMHELYSSSLPRSTSQSNFDDAPDIAAAARPANKSWMRSIFSYFRKDDDNPHKGRQAHGINKHNRKHNDSDHDMDPHSPYLHRRSLSTSSDPSSMQRDIDNAPDGTYHSRTTSSSPQQKQGITSHSRHASSTGTASDESPVSQPGRSFLYEAAQSFSDSKSNTDSNVAPLELSLCGHLLIAMDADAHKCFDENIISYEVFCKDPSLLYDENVVVRYDGELYPVHVALPLLISTLVFARPLTLTDGALKALRLSRTSSSNHSGRRPNLAASSHEDGRELEPHLVSCHPAMSAIIPTTTQSAVQNSVAEQQCSTTRKSSWFRWFRKEPNTTTPAASVSPTATGKPHSPQMQTTSPSYMKAKPLSTLDRNTNTSSRPSRYRKSLSPTSDMLRSVDLHPGRNTVVFSVESSMQGRQTLVAYLYLWEPNSTVVVSDVDGTITRSDVLGQLAPLLGSSWSQPGVATLYSRVATNGYKFVYLTSRAIGQANATRGYISGLRQGENKLPDGPIVMSPDRLFKSFHREVVDRQPQVFKIAALQSILDVFPKGRNAFYAGFGNRSTDVEAYTQVGMMPSKIFIINPKGRISHVDTQYYSSYAELAGTVDSMFPARDSHRFAPVEYTDVQYWRPTLPSLDHLESLSESDDDLVVSVAAVAAEAGVTDSESDAGDLKAADIAADVNIDVDVESGGS